MKLSVGDDQALSNAISILLGSDTKISEEGKFFSTSVKQEIMELLEDTASSHLLEVTTSFSFGNLLSLFKIHV